MVSLNDLESYDIFPETGFLPQQPPLRRLQDSYYAPWEDLVKALPTLLATKQLHTEVERMPVLYTDRLSSTGEWHRAHSILSFLCHGHIWGDAKNVHDRVSPPLTVPYMSTCSYLGLPAVANYAALVLWNWKTINDEAPNMELDNLDTLDTFTDSPDEKWFYLTSVAIEAQGASLIPLLLDATNEAAHGNVATVTEQLNTFAQGIKALTKLIKRLYEKCDPFVFYNQLRPYLTGSKGAEEAGLPHGIIYDNGDPDTPNEYVKYCGGSNAQSSLFQFFDIILSVSHQSSHTGFFQEMRQYMPPAHARFLEDVASTANLRAFAQRNGQDENLTGAFDRAIVALKTFREVHMEIVKDYVIIPKSKQARVDSPMGDAHTSTPSGTSTEGADDGACLKGTGGTPLITFLSQARDETSMTAVQPKHRRQMLQKREDIRKTGRNVVHL